MRHFLNVIGGIAGLAAILFFLAYVFANGTDLQLIGVGVFGTMLACAAGLAGVMERLEELRDKKKGA